MKMLCTAIIFFFASVYLYAQYSDMGLSAKFMEEWKLDSFGTKNRYTLYPQLKLNQDSFLNKKSDDVLYCLGKPNMWQKSLVSNAIYSKILQYPDETMYYFIYDKEFKVQHQLVIELRKNNRLIKYQKYCIFA